MQDANRISFSVCVRVWCFQPIKSSIENLIALKVILIYNVYEEWNIYSVINFYGPQLLQPYWGDLLPFDIFWHALAKIDETSDFGSIPGVIPATREKSLYMFVDPLLVSTQFPTSPF